MNTPSDVFKLKTRYLERLAFLCLALLTLTACALSGPDTISPPESTTEAVMQPQPGSQPPVILRVMDREETSAGSQFKFQEIYFTDPDGDSLVVTYKLVSSSLSYPIPLTDDPILATTDEQEGEALVTVGGRCGQKMELVFESRILDQAGNLSEPMTFQMSCTTPPVVGMRSILVSGLGITIAFGLILTLGACSLFR